MLRLSRIVYEDITATKKLLEEIELRQPPSTHYSKLLGFFRELCDFALGVAEKTPEYLSEMSQPTKELERILRRMVLLASYVARQVHSYCDSFDYADRQTVSSASIQLLNRLIDTVTKHRAFVLRGTAEFNYMYNPIGQRLSELASRLSDEIPRLDDSFAVISFPLASRDNILANCNLLHEMGHFVVDSEGLSAKLDDELENEKKNAVIEVIDRHSRLGTQYDFEFAQRKDRIREVLGNWIHETMADLIGVHLLGPAHLLAFIQLIEPLGAYQSDDDEHPCSSMRIEMMTNVLGILKWDRITKSECPETWRRALEIGRLPREASELYDACAECLPIVWDDMLRIVRRLCRKGTYKPATFSRHKGQIYALLERGIPPAETVAVGTGDVVFQSVDVVSIMNAGWFFREKDYPAWDERYRQLDSVGRGELLNRLLTKAIEIVFVKEAAG